MPTCNDTPIPPIPPIGTDERQRVNPGPEPFSRTRVRGRTERLGEGTVWGVGMRGLALTPGPSPAPLDPPQAGLWERGDSGGRLRHPIAVHGQCEHLFGPPLNAGGGGYDMSEKDAYFLLIP
jgi:hypothetical protein